LQKESLHRTIIRGYSFKRDSGSRKAPTLSLITIPALASRLPEGFTPNNLPRRLQILYDAGVLAITAHLQTSTARGWSPTADTTRNRFVSG